MMLLAVSTVFLFACAKKQIVNPSDTHDLAIAAEEFVEPTYTIQNVHFTYDAWTLDRTARLQLRKNAVVIRRSTSTAIQIEGYCDSRGSTEYNLALGERRAKAVKDYYVALGIPEAHLSTISYGEENPIVEGDTEEAYAINRCVATVIK